VKLPHATPLGEVLTFYVPKAKLATLVSPANGPINRWDFEGCPASECLHEYFLRRHNAYTHEASQIRGWWRESVGAVVDCDEHERYEVAVTDWHAAADLARLLARLCSEIGEKAIYLVYGSSANLIHADPEYLPLHTRPPVPGFRVGDTMPGDGDGQNPRFWGPTENHVWQVVFAHDVGVGTADPVTSMVADGHLATVTKGPWKGFTVGPCSRSGAWAVCELGNGVKWHAGGYTAIRLSHLRFWSFVQGIGPGGKAIPLDPPDVPPEYDEFGNLRSRPHADPHGLVMGGGI
jgi:hypothetical protein